MAALRTYGFMFMAVSLLLSGCVVRSYTVTRERVDQDLTEGNRGYIGGAAPKTMDEADRKKTRETRVVEVEFASPLKVESKPKAAVTGTKVKEPMEAEEMVDEEEAKPMAAGNKGYVVESSSPVVKTVEQAPTYTKYTVQKGDTLQKISQKLFGTTTKWPKIFEANKAALKTPDKIYPGQVINIPDVEGAKIK